MKTKTNSLTKVINFCVIALFFISTLIFFTSCDNGNSPNDNINQQQNNNSQTDYCEICDGLQTENCGIKHKCDDENCVEYSANKIYKNGHTHDYCNEDGCLLDESVRHTTHDYCEKTDCDGSTHKGQAHPEYESWFKPVSIGGEGSPYKALCIDSIKYNEANPYTTEVERFNNYQNQYKSFIEGLEFSDEFIKQFPEIKNINFAEFAEYNVNDKISYKESFDQLIGSTTDSKNGSINDACKPVIEKIINNIGSGDTADADKAYFAIYYMAICNEYYRLGYNGNLTTKNQDGTYTNSNQIENKYNNTKSKCESLCGGNEYLPFENKYFYDESGNLNPEVVKQFDEIVSTAASNLNMGVDNVRNSIILSFTASSIEGMHDTLSSVTHTHTDECYNNEMYDKVIEPVAFPSLTKAPTKLNKLNFSHDYGRELV